MIAGISALLFVVLVIFVVALAKTGQLKSFADVVVGKSYSVGDTDQDGKIDSVDAAKVSRIVAGLDPEPADICLYDVNGNGIIDIGDSIAINRVIVGLDPAPTKTCSTGGVVAETKKVLEDSGVVKPQQATVKSIIRIFLDNPNLPASDPNKHSDGPPIYLMDSNGSVLDTRAANKNGLDFPNYPAGIYRASAAPPGCVTPAKVFQHNASPPPAITQVNLDFICSQNQTQTNYSIKVVDSAGAAVDASEASLSGTNYQKTQSTSVGSVDIGGVKYDTKFENIAVGVYTISVSKAGYTSFTKSVNLAQGMMDWTDIITLTKAKETYTGPFKLNGTVKDKTTGVGIPGANVSLYFPNSSDQTPVKSGVSHEAGQYGISDIQNADYMVQVTASGYPLSVYNLKKSDITGATVTWDFALVKSPDVSVTTVISGKVYDKSKQTTNRLVWLSFLDANSKTIKSTATDSNGDAGFQFSFKDNELPSLSNIRVQLLVNGKQAIYYNPDPTTGTTYFSVEKGKSYTDKNIYLNEADISIRGRVLDELTMSPVKDTKVGLYDKDNKQVGEVITKDDGGYYFGNLNPETDYNISALAAYYDSQTVPVKTAKDGVTTQDLKLKRITVKLVGTAAIAETGELVKDVIVNVWNNNYNITRFAATSSENYVYKNTNLVIPNVSSGSFNYQIDKIPFTPTGLSVNFVLPDNLILAESESALQPISTADLQSDGTSDHFVIKNIRLNYKVKPLVYCENLGSKRFCTYYDRRSEVFTDDVRVKLSKIGEYLNYAFSNFKLPDIFVVPEMNTTCFAQQSYNRSIDLKGQEKNYLYIDLSIASAEFRECAISRLLYEIGDHLYDKLILKNSMLVENLSNIYTAANNSQCIGKLNFYPCGTVKDARDMWDKIFAYYILENRLFQQDTTLSAKTTVCNNIMSAAYGLMGGILGQQAFIFSSVAPQSYAPASPKISGWFLGRAKAAEEIKPPQAVADLGLNQIAPVDIALARPFTDTIYTVDEIIDGSFLAENYQKLSISDKARFTYQKVIVPVFGSSSSIINSAAASFNSAISGLMDSLYGKEYSVGDINQNGSLDTGDAVAIQRIIVGLDPKPADICLYDVNGDGVVDLQDATAILRIIVNLDKAPTKTCTVKTPWSKGNLRLTVTDQNGITLSGLFIRAGTMTGYINPGEASTDILNVPAGEVGISVIDPQSNNTLPVSLPKDSKIILADNQNLSVTIVVQK